MARIEESRRTYIEELATNPRVNLMVLSERIDIVFHEDESEVSRASAARPPAPKRRWKCWPPATAGSSNNAGPCCGWCLICRRMAPTHPHARRHGR